MAKSATSAARSSVASSVPPDRCILIDRRAGSGSGSVKGAARGATESRCLLDYEPLDQLGVLTDLDAGDVAFPGNGPDGSTMLIGVEVKSVSDFLSSWATGRLQDTQVPAMRAAYDVNWVLVHGGFRANERTGALDVESRGRWASYTMGNPKQSGQDGARNRTLPYAYIQGMFIQLSLAGFHVATVEDFRTAALWIGVLQRWWAKSWAEHKGLRTFDNSRTLIRQPTMSAEFYLIATIAARFSELGFERGCAAAGSFESVEEMMRADVKRWMEVPGVGKGIATSVVAAIRRKQVRTAPR